MLECVFAKFVFPCGIYIGGCISTNELIFFSFFRLEKVIHVNMEYVWSLLVVIIIIHERS